MSTTDTPTVSRPQRRYADDELIRAMVILDENGGNVAAASRSTGIPEQTIRDWRDGKVRIIPPELVAQQRLERAAKWDALQDAAVSRAMDAIDTASARDAAVVAGIATDKAAFLRGEATTVVEHRDDARVAMLRDRYSQMPVLPGAPIVLQPVPAPAPPVEQPETQ